MFNKKILLILMVGLAISFSVPAEALWLSGYEYRKEITINHTKISSDLANFPLAIMLSDTTNIIDGNDVKFTLSDGETKLDYEMESYATNDASYWVNIPTVSSGIDTTLYMYYGKTGDTDESTSDVWDSNFQGVWHLDENQVGTGNIGLYQDSTANNNDGDDYISATGQDGQIDGGQEFDGADDYIYVSNNASLTIPGDITISFWVFRNEDSSQDDFVSFGAPGEVENTNQIYDAFIRSTNFMGLTWEYAGGINTSVYSSVQVATPKESWVYYTYIRDDAAKTVTFYENGTQLGTSQSYSNSATGGTTGTLSIGRDHLAANQEVNGILDEIRISNTARTEDWIATSYYSGNGSLLTLGNEEQEGQEIIPEPASLLLLGAGIMGIMLFRKRI